MTPQVKPQIKYTLNCHVLAMQTRLGAELGRRRLFLVTDGMEKHT